VKRGDFRTLVLSNGDWTGFIRIDFRDERKIRISASELRRSVSVTELKAFLESVVRGVLGVIAGD
jgi:hypothetical protein